MKNDKSQYVLISDINNGLLLEAVLDFDNCHFLPQISSRSFQGNKSDEVSDIKMSYLDTRHNAIYSYLAFFLTSSGK